MGNETEQLRARYVLEYTYRRSLGPVLGRFLAGLRDGHVYAARTKQGRVVLPPTEWDPETGEEIAELCEVSEAGTVTSWTWIAEPRPRHLLQKPFAWALVKLDGADTPILHAVDASPSAMKTGMRVRARWKEQRTGAITDIACFVPDESAPSRDFPKPIGEVAPIKSIKTPIRIDYDVDAGRDKSRFLRACVDGRLIGGRCPKCSRVYTPPRGCPTCGVETGEEVAIKDHGIVTTFCIVNVPFEGQTMKLPYVYASIVLDGADVPIFHLVDGIEPSDVRMGLRVRAQWKPREERTPSLESIKSFVPTGEPDAPFESYQEHL
jgi:uncharacterized OB-fold protein